LALVCAIVGVVEGGFRGVLCGPNTGWHTIYIERSIGHMNCLNSAFWGSNSDKHAFKNLAYRSRIEDSLFSNVGLDGLPVDQHGNGDDDRLFSTFDNRSSLPKTNFDKTASAPIFGELMPFERALVSMAHSDRHATRGMSLGDDGDDPDVGVWVGEPNT